MDQEAPGNPELKWFNARKYYTKQIRLAGGGDMPPLRKVIAQQIAINLRSALKPSQ